MQKNAKLYRNALRGLVAALALGGLQVANAGYAQLASPAGYATTSGGHTYAAAANDRIYGRVVHQAGALTANVGGQAVKMPAAYRLAANAPRIAAAAIFANPYVRVGVGVATWLGISGLIWDESEKIWRRQLDKGEYNVKEYRWDQSYPWTTSTAACQTIVQYYNNLDAGTGYSSSIKSCGADGNVTRNRRWKGEAPGSDFRHSLEVREVPTMECPVNWTATPAGCLSPGLTQPEMVELLNPANQPGWPMPDSVPKELPLGTPLPVELPFINPEPGENPTNRPQRVPTGNPVPVPNTDPQQWRQPYVDIVPAPTPDNPWRVDVKPGEVESPNPNPAENPNPDTDTDKPTEEQDKSLCEKHPGILACSKPELDIPDGEIPKLTKQITYAEDGGFGGGSCPANLYSNIGGKNVMVYNWAETCGVVSTYLRPIILLLGAMGALFILIPGRDS